MLKKYLELARIVSTHGVHGELRAQPWCDTPEFACDFETLFFDENGLSPVRVLSARPHGNIVLFKLEGIDTVEKAQALRGKTLYFDRSEVTLPDGVDFVADLIGCAVLDADDPSVAYGTISFVSSNGANDIWHIKDAGGKERLFPAVAAFVKKTEVDCGRVFISPIKGMFDDED